MTTTSTDIFRKVADRQMTPEEGAEALMHARQKRPARKPEWMPRWLFVVGVVVLSVVFAPIINSNDRR
jgi:hypothetical protein